MRRFFAAVVLLATVLVASYASAYHWMIRHGYSGCATCHTDPSGAGLLEPYGSLIAGELLRTHYTDGATESDLGGFAFGAVALPEPVRLKLDFRLLLLNSKLEGLPLDRRWIVMQSDFAAGLRVEGFVLSASLGYADEGATHAAITREDEKNLVSRQHWVGYWNDAGSWLVRAGRMNLPFGVRTIEHTLWVRDLTSTTINDDQQHGVSVFYGGEMMRGELMAIAGNFQIRPDDYRERGYSGYLEVSVIPELSLGASSLVTHKQLDASAFEKTWRHAHGLMGRWATPHEPLVVASEFDYVLTSSRNAPHRKGIVGFLQADYELVQGLHVLLTGETRTVGIDDTPASYAAWLSYQWFFAPHADLRLDSVYYRLRSRSLSTGAYALLAQLHVYL
jgi:hypothetical protein